jgi:PTH1 family peptidyl-tRNA hydrolase
MRKLKKKKNWLKKKCNSNHLAIVGLGNPGPQYEGTRHNVGFRLIELLQEQLNLSIHDPFFQSCLWIRWNHSSGSIIFIKPQTFMNRSGQIFPWIKRKFSLENQQILVAIDNMDLPPGGVRVKTKGSSAGHNGLKSIMSELNTGDFPRLYIGVGRPQGISVVDHVLGLPDEEQSRQMEQSIEQCAEQILAQAGKPLGELWDAINRS